MWADQALERFVGYGFETCLDIGSGSGEHARYIRGHGKRVTEIDLQNGSDYLDGTYHADAVWCSHCLEHQPNPQLFLKKIFEEVADVVCITVPPAKHDIVGGHVTIWNAGLLLYNLILAGFDCKQARVGIYGYNISVIVRKKQAVLPNLNHDCGDIEKLAQFFPFSARQGFDGRLGNINW